MNCNDLKRWWYVASFGLALAASSVSVQSQELTGVKILPAEFDGEIPSTVLEDLFAKPAVPAHNLPVPTKATESRPAAPLTPSPATVASPAAVASPTAVTSPIAVAPLEKQPAMPPERPLGPLLPSQPAAETKSEMHLAAHQQPVPAEEPVARLERNPAPAATLDPTVSERLPRFPNYASLRTYQIEQQPAPEPLPSAGNVSPEKDVVYIGEPMEACGDYDHCGCTWIFGLEETFLVPVRNGLDAEIRLVNPEEIFDSNGDNNMEFGPRIWFGIQHGCWQFRGRFWALNGVEDDTNPLLLGTGDTIGLANGSYLDALTVDAEALRLFCCDCDWNFYVGFGFRYAKLNDVANLTGTSIDDQVLPATVQATALAFHEIDGCGITVPFGGFKPLHRFCCSTLDCFWNLRGSVIWGDIDSTAQTSVIVFDPNGPGAASRLDAASASTNDEMFIGELQVGLRWTHYLQCCPATASMWIAFEGQWWDSDGGFAFAESAALVNDNGGLGRASAGPNVELQLIGFSIGAGLNW